jgi:hypothetical protein
MVTMTRKDVVATVSVAGIIVRYGFYLIGALTLALIAIAITTAWGWRVRTIDAKPAFRIAAPELARLPLRSKVILSWHGRIETRHYGQVYDRDMDFTVALIMPPSDGVKVTLDGLPDIPDIKPLRNRRVVSNTFNHDLETRFGPLRATEVRVDTDGRWKQCLTYYSRFASESVTLAGWYCDASGGKPSPDRLACLLDRLVLDAPLDSREADSFMREQGSRATRCSASPVSQTIDTRSSSNYFNSSSNRMKPPSNWSRPAPLWRQN